MTGDEEPLSKPKTPFFNTTLMRRAMQFLLLEIGLSAINFFVLINLVYQPRWGELTAHQIGMSTRIGYILVLAYFVVRPIRRYNTRDLFMVGLFWMGSWLVLEWVGSFFMRRPISEILVGWNILNGYMWPYVLITYLLSCLIVGAVMRSLQKTRV